MFSLIKTNFNTIIKLPDDILNSTNTYYKKIPDDTRLDIISYQEYSDIKYVDLIMLINEITNVALLPKSNNYIDKLVTTEYNSIKSKNTNLTTSDLEGIKLELDTKYYNRNELYRNLIFVKEAYLVDVIERITNANDL